MKFTWNSNRAILALLILAGLIACNQGPEIIEETENIAADITIPDKIDFNFHVKPILSDRCYKCHGPDANTREADLAFHDKEMATAKLGDELDRQAIIAGDDVNSELVKRIFSNDPNEVMPPPESNLLLNPWEKKVLKKWIKQGAEWKSHWAFIPPQERAFPQVENVEWVNNEIDYFVLKKMEEKELSPSKSEHKEKLLRRLSFDLTGLPPSLEDLERFLNNQEPNALEAEIDRLLNSPTYAERMANEWMDIARYADTHGYQDDFERIMWPWRDWVIHAFNKNMPYKDFITWQLAGDQFPNPSQEQIIATGFNRNHKITFEGGSIDEEFRVEYVSDRVHTFGKSFLGLNLECARCHDHKFDPISQKEYYSIFSYFNNVPEKGFIEGDGTIPEPYINLTAEDIVELKFINNKDSMENIPLMVMREMEESRPTYLLDRGLYDKPVEVVQAATPAFIKNTEAKSRLDLANWLFDEEHPLTSRVIVNRLWQQLFGIGIVSSSFDLGNQGSLPSHPELLDFLALKMQELNWDIKAMLKYICLSATYQQSCKFTEEQVALDPENIYLSRAPRIRLSAEMIRDQVLFVSGLLNTTIGGPSVKPYQPEGIWEETTGGGGGVTARYSQSTGSDLYRRSLYTYWKRTVPPPAMTTMDAPTRDFCTVQREETNTPLQALILMNDPQIIEASRVLADKAMNEFGVKEDIISYIFEKCTSRKIEKDELDILVSLFREEMKAFEQNPDSINLFLGIGNSKTNAEGSKVQLAAYTLVTNTILNLDETISRG